MFKSRVLAVAAVLAVGGLLAGCEDNLTPESYDGIVEGQSTLSEVETMLGGSGEDQTAGGVGIGSTGLEGQQATEQVYIWKDGDKQIIVTFRDGKVYKKRQVGVLE